jgi:hypothetical protein
MRYFLVLLLLCLSGSLLSCGSTKKADVSYLSSQLMKLG